MYTFSNRLKIFSVALIVLGLAGWLYSYSTSHVSLDEVKTLLAEETSHDSHGESADHATVEDAHVSEAAH